MTKTFERLHPMACSCRACRAPRQAANISENKGRRFHPIACAILLNAALWAIIIAIAFEIWGAAQ